MYVGACVFVGACVCMYSCVRGFGSLGASSAFWHLQSGLWDSARTEGRAAGLSPYRGEGCWMSHVHRVVCVHVVCACVRAAGLQQHLADVLVPQAVEQRVQQGAAGRWHQGGVGVQRGAGRVS